MRVITCKIKMFDISNTKAKKWGEMEMYAVVRFLCYTLSGVESLEGRLGKFKMYTSGPKATIEEQIQKLLLICQPRR